jgi:hypothetical protein
MIPILLGQSAVGLDSSDVMDGEVYDDVVHNIRMGCCDVTCYLRPSLSNHLVTFARVFRHALISR